MGWGRGKRGRKGVSLHLLSLLFASLFPLSLRKLYTQAKNIKKSYSATTLTIQIKGIMQCQQKSRLSQSASGKKKNGSNDFVLIIIIIIIIIIVIIVKNV